MKFEKRIRKYPIGEKGEHLWTKNGYPEGLFSDDGEPCSQGNVRSRRQAEHARAWATARRLKSKPNFEKHHPGQEMMEIKAQA
ncbi:MULTISPECIES: hypothetical protein [Corynebacterium]|uniref:hypothetical protein n=1 Tax=Corynebacterium TaxID=1716 RepID=UPI0015895B96|nr:hypothetical protein [Corynebacterium sp. Marseille-Q2823]